MAYAPRTTDIKSGAPINPSHYHESVPKVGISFVQTRNDLPRLIASRRAALATAFSVASKIMYTTAYRQAPVDTGYMRSTIKEATVLNPAGGTYAAGLVIGAHYWKYVNYGSAGRAAKPFVTQGVEAGRRTLEAELDKINRMTA